MEFLGSDVGQNHHIWPYVVSTVCLYALYQVFATFYDVYYGPLSNFPGPKRFAVTQCFLIAALCRGEEHAWKLDLHRRYGPVVRIAPRALSYNTSQAWQDIYGLPKGGRGGLQKDPEFYIAPVNGVRDLFASINARDHRRVRKMIAPAFSEKALKDQEPLLKQWVELLARKLREKSSAGEIVDLKDFYNFTTMDIMADLTFSDPLHMLESEKYHPWFDLTFGTIKELVIVVSLQMLPGLSLLLKTLFAVASAKTRREHLKFAADRVDRRIQNGTTKPDFWSYIMSKGADGLSREEMHSNGWTFMIAGTETSATLISGASFYLMKNPTEMENLVREIRETFKSVDDISIETLRNLPYLNACIEEALRIYPPAPLGFPRITPIQGAQIDGDWVPPGTTVSVSHWAACHTESNFASPDEFIPERWLSMDKRFEKDDKAALQPFSIGTRDCIGRILAYHEIRLILCRVLWEFDLELDARSRNWADQKAYRLWVKPPLWVKLRPRTAAD